MDINKYNLEFILNARGISAEEINNSLIEFGEKVKVSLYSKDEFKICLRTEDPTIIFDTCAQFGRIKSVKIQEDSLQYPTSEVG